MEKNTLEPPEGSPYGDNPPQFLLDAMMEELGIGRINDLSLEDNPKDRRNANVPIGATLAKAPTKEIKKITNKYGNEINMWQSFRPDDVDQDALLLDDLGSGQSHRLRMQASLAGSSNQGGNDSRGSRGGHNGGSHIGGSSRSGGLVGQSNRRNRAPIEEIANLLRFSDPLSAIRGGRGGGRGGNNGRVGVNHGHFVQGSNNSPQHKNIPSGQAKQQVAIQQKATQRRPPQQKSVQRNYSAPLLDLATPESFFPNAKKVENTPPQTSTAQTTSKQASARQPITKPPVVALPTTRQPATKSLAPKPPATKPPASKSPATGQLTNGPVAPVSKPSKPTHVNPDPGLSKNNAPDNTRAIPDTHDEEDLISFNLISLDDNDSWVSSSTEVVTHEPASGYMKDMWTLEENAEAVFNMIVENTMKGMAKDKQERVVLMDSLANGVIPDGRGISSSVYASDEPPVTKESINKYWKTQGPPFRKGLENDSIRLILEGAAAEIVRRDAPTSSDLGQQDVPGSVSNDSQSNSEDGFMQIKQVMPENLPAGAQADPDEDVEQTKKADTLDTVTTEPAGNAPGSENAAEDPKKPEPAFLQYGASELLQLRDRALTVDKTAFRDEIRPFVVKNTNELLQKPKVMKVLGGLADSKWASPKTNNENVAPTKVNPIPSKINAPSSKVKFDPSRETFVPRNTTLHGSTDNTASNIFVEDTKPTKTMSGPGDSKWADDPKASDTYTPLDFASAISSASVPARPQRRGLNDSIEVATRVINPQLTFSNKERRKKLIEIITEATKRRTAVLEKAAAEQEVDLAN
ncbi:hypothetical protein V497_08144 [Pseudogymnoascus sp. VKM F-4516 (FW-969)]|nr:hypothetical protein V497_08144 [Pseudogymnoascus sp. VKM F-4516 (FW-969)]